MFIDAFMLEEALAVLFSDPNEEWKDWGVGKIADWLMEYMENHE